MTASDRHGERPAPVRDSADAAALLERAVDRIGARASVTAVFGEPVVPVRDPWTDVVLPLAGLAGLAALGIARAWSGLGAGRVACSSGLYSPDHGR